MARRIARGEIWLHTFAPPDKRRPVLVISRQHAIDAISTVMVAPITTKVRGLPSEVLLGVEHGMKSTCAVNLDHVQSVRQSDLKRCVATIAPDMMTQVCRALAIATGCA